jgi:hypothetical protein
MCIGYNIQQPHNILFLRRGKNWFEIIASCTSRQSNEIFYRCCIILYNNFECKISKASIRSSHTKHFSDSEKNSNALPSELIKRHSIKGKSWKSLDTVSFKIHWPLPKPLFTRDVLSTLVFTVSFGTHTNIVYKQILLQETERGTESELSI